MSVLRDLCRLVARHTHLPVSRREREQALALRREIVRHYEEERFLEAAAAARRLLELQRQLTGEMHPDYATGLCNLSLIFEKQENWSGAEAVLRQALMIRKVTLGERHPNYQANLKRLNEVEDYRSAWDEPRAFPSRIEHPGPEPQPQPEAPTPTEARSLAREAGAMADSYIRLAGPLTEAAHRLRDRGIPPPLPLLEGMAEAIRDFLALRARVRQRAEEERVATGDDEGLTSLQDLAALLDRVAEAEARRAQAEEDRRGALAILDRIEGLSYVKPAAFPPLDACRDQARALRQSIADRGDAPPESDRLAPFSTLLTLIESGHDMSEDQWSILHATTASAFDSRLAAAAVLGRIVARNGRAPDAIDDQGT